MGAEKPMEAEGGHEEAYEDLPFRFFSAVSIGALKEVVRGSSASGAADANS